MGKVNLNNPHKLLWIKNTEQWIVNNAEIKEKNIVLNCPRCGLRLFSSSNKIRSQYANYDICSLCGEDEIVRDSLGNEQIELDEWYISTGVKMGYLKRENNCSERYLSR